MDDDRLNIDSIIARLLEGKYVNLCFDAALWGIIFLAI